MSRSHSPAPGRFHTVELSLVSFSNRILLFANRGFKCKKIIIYFNFLAFEMNPEAAARLWSQMMAAAAAGSGSGNSEVKSDPARSPANSVASHHSSTEGQSPKTESPSPATNNSNNSNSITPNCLEQLNQLWQMMLNKGNPGMLPPGLPNFMGFPGLPTPGFTMNPQEVSLDYNFHSLMNNSSRAGVLFGRLNLEDNKCVQCFSRSGGVSGPSGNNGTLSFIRAKIL